MSTDATATPETDVATTNDPSRPFIFDVNQIPGYTLAEMFANDPNREQMFEIFGRDLVTKVLVQSPNLSVFHESAKPGERVKPHRHGTHQLNFMLRGELIFGNQRVTAGMGYFTPDMLYAWRAGDDGAEWIEIHAGQPGIYLDRPDS